MRPRLAAVSLRRVNHQRYPLPSPARSIFLLIALLCSATSAAAPLSLSINEPTGLYRQEQPIRIRAEPPAASEGTPSGEQESELAVTIFRNNTEILWEDRMEWRRGAPTLVFEDSFEEPLSLIVRVARGEDADSIGAIVAPEQLQPGSPRPEDFDDYWRDQKRLLAELPLETESSPISLDEDLSGFLAFDVTISSLGPRPARGILARPADARPGSLPIVLLLRAAGVKGQWCRSQRNEALDLAGRGNGALAFDLNAHGMLNHEPESYYEALEAGPLNRYWEIGLRDRDDFYFRYMYLRMLRAIEYLAQQPEWDGQRILVIGESQGGGQALAAAGLDARVTAAAVVVPALCDFGGPLAGRKGGWPQPLDTRVDDPAVQRATSYFDAAHLLAGSRATIWAEVGLIDETCPATSIYAALNQSAGETIIHSVPYRAHGWPEGEDRERWERSVLASRNAFIDDYLK